MLSHKKKICNFFLKQNYRFREVEAANQEQSTFLAYDKRVKELAAELTGKENFFRIQATSSTVNFPNAAGIFF